MQKSISFLVSICFSVFLSAQISPFSTGQISSQNIGQLEDESVVFEPESGYGFIDFFFGRVTQPIDRLVCLAVRRANFLEKK
jgi:hypothetical protein